jgi:hypothetical protein
MSPKGAGHWHNKIEPGVRFWHLSQHRLGTPRSASTQSEPYLRLAHAPAWWTGGPSDPKRKLSQTERLGTQAIAVICSAVQSSGQKYFASRFGRSRLIDSSYPVPGNEGRTRRHERWVRDAVDASAACDERGRGGRRSRVVLMPRRWHQLATILRIARGR